MLLTRNAFLLQNMVHEIYAFWLGLGMVQRLFQTKDKNLLKHAEKHHGPNSQIRTKLVVD